MISVFMIQGFDVFVLPLLICPNHEHIKHDETAGIVLPDYIHQATTNGHTCDSPAVAHARPAEKN